MNNSLSITLDAARTTTTVEFEDDLSQDQVVLDGRAVEGAARERIVQHLDLLRALAQVNTRARVISSNSFPSGAGLASSASGFAALTVAAARALGLDLTPRELSRWARRGSGSAARSVFGGYVEWLAAERDADSFAVQIAPPEHWPVCDCIAIVSPNAKAVGSTRGHALAKTSPLYEGRVAQVARELPRLRRAIAERDFATLGEIAEADALSMHAVMLTSQPSLLYWSPETITLMRAVRAWREEGMPVYFTIDAGPNVHVLTLPYLVAEVERRLKAMPAVKQVIICRPGKGAEWLNWSS